MHLIAHLTDLHLDLANKVEVDTATLIERTIEKVLALRQSPDCVVISGDLTESGTVQEYERLRELLDRLPQPVYLIPGNHDDRLMLRSVFAAYPGVALDPEFVMYAVDEGPLRLVMLDTVDPGRSEGALCPRRLAWLRETLAAEPNKPTLLIMHHPPIAIGIGGIDVLRLNAGADELQAIVASHRNIERVLCGHYHRQTFARWGGTVVSTGAAVARQLVLDLRADAEPHLTPEPPAFQIHAWLDDGTLVSHQVDVAGAQIRP